MDRIELLNKLAEVADAEFPTKAEVASVIGEIVKALKQLSTTIPQLISSGDDQAVKTALERFLTSPEFSALQSVTSTHLPKRIDALLTRVENVERGVDDKIGPVERRVTRIEDENLEERVSNLENAEGPEMPQEETSESIREKLGMLPLDAITGLTERLDALWEAIDSRPTGGGSTIAYSRGQIKLYDLSSQLNGVAKTFNLPAFWRVISVQSSSSPNAFRPTVDYTTDASVPAITFTSQVDAASVLSAGQTLTLIYAEP